MPIHDQGYRRYLGERLPRGRAWMVIAGTGIRTMIRRRGFVVLLLVAWFPFFVRAVQLYASANLPQASFLAFDAGTFRQFLGQQGLFVFFVSVYAGAGLIANDRRANALQIYLSKPITRGEYIVGKLTILAAFLLFVTWLPAMLLLILQGLFAGSFTFLTSHLYLVPAITLFACIDVAASATAMLALSSLSKSSRYVGIVYAALMFFSSAVFGVLQAAGGQRWSWISMTSNLDQIADHIFGLPVDNGAVWPVPVFVIAALVAVSAWGLVRRVRGVEVVA